MAIDPFTPATLYAGTIKGGVFKSTNGGNSWTAINSGLTTPSIKALAIDPSNPATLYAGTGGGVFKSTNGGTTWQPTGANVFLTVGGGLALAIDRFTPATLYAGTFAFGVFKSTNGGTSWTDVNSGLPMNPIVYSLAIDPFTPSTLYAGTDGGVFKSTNGGTSWNPFNSGLTATDVQAQAIDPTTPATLYAGAWDPGDFYNAGGVFKSTNGGNSWTAFNSGLTATDVQALAIDPTTPATLYAGTIGSRVAAYSVFKSTNGGTSWTAASSGLPANTEVNALAIDPSTPATLYAGTGDLFSGNGGVFKSTDRGTTWQPTGTGAQPCTYAISPLGQPFYYPGGASGGAGTVTVTAGSGCAWTATSNSSFLTITSGSSGSGNGTVGYSVAANSGTASRTGTLTIAGQTLLVTQAGTVCTFAVSPPGQAIAASGGIASVAVKTDAICSWQATSNSSFLSIIGFPAGTRANGNGSFAYSVQANTSTGSRTGTLTVAEQTFTVTQAGTACTYTISPASRSFSASGGIGTVDVTTGSGCTWAATSNDPWITITSGFSGTGDGTVGYSVAAFASGNSRTGTLNIAGQTFVVLQLDGFTSCKTPEPSFYAISPESQSFAASGGTGTVAVTAGSNCSWLATSNSSFLTITSGFGGFGNGATGYSVAANSGTASRTGTLSIAGKAFTVTQAGNPGSGGNKPVIRAANGVVNGASFLPGIVPGSFATIFGTNLASTTTGKDWSGSITNGQLPTQIDGVSVSIAGKPAYIEYIRQDQINLQVPDVGVGPVQVTVTNSDGASDPATVTSQQFGPAFFLFGTKYAVTQHYPDYGYSSNPSWVPGAVAAKPGDILILWGTGFGPTNPAVPAGLVPPPTGPIVTGGGIPVTVTVGGVTAQLISAVLSPYTGVYQIAIQLPSTLPNGDVPITASIGSYQSPDNVYIYVQN